jgi:N-acetyl-anhydromuramyl-L-alanine amidase AmpD
MNITRILTTNFFASRDGWKPKWLILHGTAGGGSAQNVAAYFQSTEGTANPVSAHYVIGQDGAIVQCVSEADGAWANGVVEAGHDAWWSETDDPNPNDVTISIEHCKPATDNSDPLTPAQQASSFALIKDICERNEIPMRLADANGGIIGHYSIAPISRARCPGTYPWVSLWQYLSGEETMTIDINNAIIANYFKISGNGWVCQNGFILANAMLTFYQSFGNKDLCGLTYLGLPLGNEIGFGQGRTFQRFERGVLVYDPSHTNDNPPGLGQTEQVYLAHLEGGIGQDPRIADLQAQLNANNQAQAIATLQGKIAAAQKALAA